VKGFYINLFYGTDSNFEYKSNVLDSYFLVKLLVAQL